MNRISLADQEERQMVLMRAVMVLMRLVIISTLFIYGVMRIAGMTNVQIPQHSLALIIPNAFPLIRT